MNECVLVLRPTLSGLARAHQLKPGVSRPTTRGWKGVSYVYYSPEAAGVCKVDSVRPRRLGKGTQVSVCKQRNPHT